VKRAAYALGAIALLAALAVLLAPLVIDTPAVRAEIQRRMGQVLEGEISWEALEIGLFPAPHGVLRRMRVEIPGRASAAADAVRVYLQLWPLLRGRAEIASVAVSRPELRIGARQEQAKSEKEPFDAVSAYRTALEPVVKALQQFAPDTVVRIEQAAVDPGELRDLNASLRTAADGMTLELATASRFWKQLRLEARVAYADLSASGRVELDALELDRDLPAAMLRADLRTDASTSIESDFEASLGSVATAKGRLVFPAGKPPELRGQVDAPDLAKAYALVQRKLPGLDGIESAEGRLSAKVDLSLGQPWQAHVDVVKSEASVKLAQLPWKLSARSAQLTVTQERLGVAGLQGSVGDSAFEGLAADIVLGKAPRVSAASGRATVKLEQWLPWLQTKLPLEDIAALSGTLEVQLKRMSLAFDRPADVDFEAVASPRGISAGLKALPAPVSVAGGSLRVDRATLRLDKIAVAMLDARAQVSGSFSLKNRALELALAEGALGEKALQWALKRAEVAERFEPRTPLRFAAQRIAWAPKGAVQADARVEFEGGPQAALALTWMPERLEVQRLAIKDAASDAVLGVTVADGLVRASFAGVLHGRSIAAMLRHPGPETASGRMNGKLRLTLDRAQPRRTLAEGRLRAEALDLSWLAGKRAIVERIDLTAEPSGARVVDARFDWEEQLVNLRGEVKRTAQGPVIDARLESPGVVLDRLLPEPKAADAGERSKIWPLPVTGSIEVRSGFVQYKERTVAPLEGRLSLERERARLEVKEARMCGVSFPLEVEANAQEVDAAAHITMRNEPLENAVRCLTGDTIQISGNADLRAELRTRGRRPELLRNLTGTLQAEARKGRVQRFALIGNILSLRNIASVTEAKDGGFPYRSLSAKGHFERGEFILEEGFFDSDAARLAAHGTVDLFGDQSQLTVLVGLLTTVERVAGAIPILGYVLGGAMTALPVGVSGDIRNPLVVPLGPRAVTDTVLGIFERTLKLPGKLVLPATETKTP
jgi:hypothetical protein